LEVLDENVGLGEHGLEHRLVSRFGEVEHHRLFAAIEPDEIGALAVHQAVITAGEVAFRPLDLDHARAGVGELAGAVRRGDGLLDRNDEEAFERQSHLNTTAAGRARAQRCRTGSYWWR